MVIAADDDVVVHMMLSFPTASTICFATSMSLRDGVGAPDNGMPALILE